ncbi:MAG TPA: DEAD/DEAH box helicase [Streptosporangiaceae bacterium]
MQRAMLPHFNAASLGRAVGSACYAKGAQYAQQQAVVNFRWDSAENVLRGTVLGSADSPYATTAYFSLAAGARTEFEWAECSCPVGLNCKHAVALVLTATAQGATWAAKPASWQVAPPAAQDVPRSTVPRPAVPLRTVQGSAVPLRAVPQPAAWEQSLDSLLGCGRDAPARSGETPLAVELTLAADTRPAHVRGAAAAGPAPPKLLARLVRPGKNGGWVSSGLSWGKLDTLHLYGDYPDPQVRLLRELYALYRSHGGNSAYYGYPYGSYGSYGSYGDDRSIDMSAFGSRQLWPLLDEAESTGLQLVRARRLGVLEKYRRAELCLDVTRGESSGALLISTVIHVEEAPVDAVPVAFIGSEGHGLVCVDRAEIRRTPDPGSWRFSLAKLAKPATAQLQQMALGGQRLEVPSEEQSRFLDGYYPRLRRAATVICSDGSFTPPVISGPDLVLQARYGTGHNLDVSWEWAYQVGDAPFRVPLYSGAAEDGFRDPDAERIALAHLDLPLDRFGLLGAGHGAAGPRGSGPGPGPGPGRGPGPGPRLGLAPHTHLSGFDTMRFSTELLPLLADHPGIIVEITGEPADYREAGDTLRIAVSTDAVAGDTDWFDLGVTITVEGRTVPFLDVFLALSRGEPHLLLADGAYFSLHKPELAALARLIEEARGLQDSPGDTLRISRYQAGLWDELAGLGVVEHQAAAWQDQVQGLLSAGAVGRVEPPPALRARLRPYQQDGFGWLAFLWEHRLGGILADDMGLGKTVQSLAMICHARQADPAIPPFLIVAPTSVVPNWAAEAARFAPDLKVVPISDTMARRGQDLGELVAGAAAVVTTYALLRIDFDAYAALGWSGLLLDEAQNAKNRQTKIYQCARLLPAPVKIAITGTPMENNLMELWSLLSITAPGLFPSPTRFRDYYAQPIEKRGDAELLAQLQRRIKPLVKRRTKDQVIADLPAKQEQVLEVDLHPQHRKLYQTHLQRERQKILGLIDDMNANRFTIFRSLTLLRQLSLHAGLIDDEHGHLPSSKIDALLGHLRDVAGGGHRALVFSQFTGFLDRVRERLDADGIRYCYLDGKTRNRAAVLQRFKEGTDPVFLISLKAGGFGLNLTEADYCFLLDPWWNPATEAQAVDRTHRIGQTRNVMVYRLVARDTIEEKVMALKERKARLFTSVMDEVNVFGTALDADDIRELFT